MIEGNSISSTLEALKRQTDAVKGPKHTLPLEVFGVW